MENEVIIMTNKPRFEW